jgi:hypothetical protein
MKVISIYKNETKKLPSLYAMQFQSEQWEQEPID